MDWVAIPLTHSTSGTYISGDGLMLMLLAPFLGGGVVLTVIEHVLGYTESKSFAVLGGLFFVLTVFVAPEFDFAVARALRRTFGWRIGFQVGRPLTLYWGIWAAIGLLVAYNERTESREGPESG